jgi:hypothetical protein
LTVVEYERKWLKKGENGQKKGGNSRKRAPGREIDGRVDGNRRERVLTVENGQK